MQKNNIQSSLIIVLSFFIIVLFCVLYFFGSLRYVSARINGESVYISPPVVNLGQCQADSDSVANFRITNLNSKKISVVGQRSSCDCALPEHLPIIVSQGKTADIKIIIRLPKHESYYDQTITLMVAEPNRLAMYPVRVTATIPNPLPQPVE
jgi:hypothetical protein